jgi:antirestriction protein ArdC
MAAANYFTGTEYQGKNAAELSAKGYEQDYWATYKQWFEHGYQVQKGEHGTAIMVVRDAKDKKPGKKMVKFYRVFNIDQVQEIEETKEEATA